MLEGPDTGCERGTGHVPLEGLPSALPSPAPPPPAPPPPAPPAEGAEIRSSGATDYSLLRSMQRDLCAEVTPAAEAQGNGEESAQSQEGADAAEGGGREPDLRVGGHDRAPGTQHMGGQDIWDLAEDETAEAWACRTADLGGDSTRIRGARAALAEAGVRCPQSMLDHVNLHADQWDPEGHAARLREPLEHIAEGMARRIRCWLGLAPCVEGVQRALGTTSGREMVLRAGDPGGEGGSGARDTCAICLEDVHEQGGIRWPGGCRHWYHIQCYAALIGHRHHELLCPQCRCPGEVCVQPESHPMNMIEEREAMLAAIRTVQAWWDTRGFVGPRGQEEQSHYRAERLGVQSAILWLLTTALGTSGLASIFEGHQVPQDRVAEVRAKVQGMAIASAEGLVNFLRGQVEHLQAAATEVRRIAHEDLQALQPYGPLPSYIATDILDRIDPLWSIESAASEVHLGTGQSSSGSEADAPQNPPQNPPQAHGSGPRGGGDEGNGRNSSRLRAEDWPLGPYLPFAKGEGRPYLPHEIIMELAAHSQGQVVAMPGAGDTLAQGTGDRTATCFVPADQAGVARAVEVARGLQDDGQLLDPDGAVLVLVDAGGGGRCSLC